MTITNYIATFSSLSSAALIHLYQQKSHELALLKNETEVRIKSIQDDSDSKVEKLNILMKESKLAQQNNGHDNSQVKSLNDKIHHLSLSNSQLTHELEKQKNQYKSELKSDQATIKQLKVRIDQLETESLELSKQHDFKLNTHVEQLIVSKDGEIAKLKSQLESLMKDKQMLESSFDKFKTGNNKLIVELRQRNDNDIEAKDKQITDLEHDYQSMNSDFIRVSKDLKDSKEVIVDFEKMATELKMTQELLHEEISNEKKTKSKMMEKITFLDERISSQSKEIIKLREENSNLLESSSDFAKYLHDHHNPTHIDLQNISSSEDDYDDEINQPFQLIPHKPFVSSDNFVDVLVKTKRYIEELKETVTEDKKLIFDSNKEVSKLKEALALAQEHSLMMSSREKSQEPVTLKDKESSSSLDKESGLPLDEVEKLQQTAEEEDLSDQADSVIEDADASPSQSLEDNSNPILEPKDIEEEDIDESVKLSKEDVDKILQLEKEVQNEVNELKDKLNIENDIQDSEDILTKFENYLSLIKLIHSNVLDISSQLDYLKDENNDKVTKLEQLKLELSTHEKELELSSSKSNEKINTLTEKIESLTSELKSSEEKVNKLKLQTDSTINELKESSFEKDIKFKDLNNNINNYVEHLKISETRLQLKIGEFEALKNEFDLYRKEAKEDKEHLMNEMDKELSKAKKQIESLKSDNNELKEKISNLEEENKLQEETYQNKIEQLQSEIANLKKFKESLELKESKLSKELKKVHDNYDVLEGEKKTLMTDYYELLEAVQHMETKSSELKSEIQDKSKQLEDNKEKLKNSNSKIRELESSLEKAEKEFLKSSLTLQNTQQELKDSGSKLDESMKNAEYSEKEFKQQLDNGKSELEKIKKDFENGKSESKQIQKDLNQKLNESNCKLNNLKEELKKSIAESESLKQELETKLNEQEHALNNKSVDSIPSAKTDEKNSVSINNEENKPIESKPIENKPIENKPIENKPMENKPIENKPMENKPIENKPIENKPIENKPIENKPIEIKPIKVKSDENIENESTSNDNETIEIEADENNLYRSKTEETKINSIDESITKLPIDNEKEHKIVQLTSNSEQPKSSNSDDNETLVEQETQSSQANSIVDGSNLRQTDGDESAIEANSVIKSSSNEIESVTDKTISKSNDRSLLENGGEKEGDDDEEENDENDDDDRIDEKEENEKGVDTASNSRNTSPKKKKKQKKNKKKGTK